MTRQHDAPCTTGAKPPSRASSLEALLAVGQEAVGCARARRNGSPLAHSRMTPSGEPEMVYLRGMPGTVSVPWCWHYKQGRLPASKSYR